MTVRGERPGVEPVEQVFEQDMRHVVVQEYWDHWPYVPQSLAADFLSRIPSIADLVRPTATLHYRADGGCTFNDGGVLMSNCLHAVAANYHAGILTNPDADALTVGEPLKLAESMRNWFNGIVQTGGDVEPNTLLSNFGQADGTTARIFDDTYVAGISQIGDTCQIGQPIITGGPSYATVQRRAVVVNGVIQRDAESRIIFDDVIITGDPILTTVPVAPDRLDDPANPTAILCGDGTVRTTPNNQPGDRHISISSGWRNPERNEAVGGVINSRHQFGGAVDFQTETLVIGTELGARIIAISRQYCVLEHTGEQMLLANYRSNFNNDADLTRKKAIAENGSIPTACDGSRLVVSHVHVELN